MQYVLCRIRRHPHELLVCRVYSILQVCIYMQNLICTGTLLMPVGPGGQWQMHRDFHLQVAQVILRNIEEYWKWLVILMNIDTY